MSTKPKIWKSCFMLILLISVFLYGWYKYSNNLKEIKNSNPYNLEIYRMIGWIKENTKDSDVILTQWTLGPFIYGMADRKVIATTKVYPSEVAIVSERYSDLAKFFFSTNEEDAFEIVRKYNVSYVVVPKKFDFINCGYILACHTLNKKNETLIFRFLDNSNLNKFKLVYGSEWFKIYELLPYEFKSASYAEYVDIEIRKYLEKNISRKKSAVIGSIIPHDVYHASQIIIENLALIENKYDKIVILGPDHNSRSGHFITSSDLNWQGFSGYMQPDLTTIKKLKIPIDNGAHKFEWSIRTILPFIHYWQINATVVPILFRYDVPYEKAVDFGEKLAEIIDDKTLVVASIDFSHIIPANEEINKMYDYVSFEVISKLKSKYVYSLNAEGKPALVAFLTAIEKKNVKNVQLLNISSQSYPKGDSTISVGYISLHYSK